MEQLNMRSNPIRAGGFTKIVFSGNIDFLIKNLFVRPFGGRMPIILFKLNYLDPGSGSLLVQLLAAGLLGTAGVMLKMFWGRIKAFLKGEKYVPPAPVEDAETEEEK